MKTYLLLIIGLFVVSTTMSAQFDVEAYKEYLKDHENMTYDDLLSEFPIGLFKSDAPTIFEKSEYADSIKKAYNLTDYELSLINNHSFMVSDRLSHYTFIHAYWDIFIKDLPVYISADAMLHALHYTFSKVLVDVEENLLYDRLDSALSKIKTELNKTDFETNDELYNKALNDLDVYITVGHNLLTLYGDTTKASNPPNQVKIDEILEMIKSESYVDFKLFTDITKRELDFSQFTVRGHYTRSDKLSAYFKTMMWFGRTEVLVTNPKNNILFKYTDDELQRMAILTALCAEFSDKTGAMQEFQDIDKALTTLLGKQDNINLNEVRQIMQDNNLKASDLTDPGNYELFKSQLLSLSSSNQHYSSQILYTNVVSPDKVVPPSVFLLMGQRPILDGFITANVVFDKILFNNTKVFRMVPSTLDVLFALGNDASTQFLKKEMEKYPYASNLAAVRYLIDSYDEEYWESNSYTNWLNSIKSLNPPKNRDNLPPFMQTAAWWQKTMNTQLASWAEMRHDFLLYAKQPYTSSYSCSYPYGYVEPVPELYQNMKSFINSIHEMLIDINYSQSGLFIAEHWANVCDNLTSMSNKILAGEEFSYSETDFFCNLIKEGKVCDAFMEENTVGWYPELYYGFDDTEMYDYLNHSKYADETDKFVVADVHTIPMDENANLVGWVLHAGTGEINLAVIAAPTVHGGSRAYVGPVSSYYEFISNDFKRYTNEEWRERDEDLAGRPNFTNLYMADDSGNKPDGEVISLSAISTSVNDRDENLNKINLSCSPNPFGKNLNIKINVPDEMLGSPLVVNIINQSGEIIKSFNGSTVQHNNYTILWDGLDKNDTDIVNGTYIIDVRIGTERKSTKVIFNR